MLKKELEDKVASLEKMLRSNVPSRELTRKVDYLEQITVEQEQRVSALEQRVSSMDTAAGALYASLEEVEAVLGRASEYVGEPKWSQALQRTLSQLQRAKTQFDNARR